MGRMARYAELSLTELLKQPRVFECERVYLEAVPGRRLQVKHRRSFRGFEASGISWP